MELQKLYFSAPTPDAPYYFVKAALTGAPDVELEVAEVRVNGVRQNPRNYVSPP